jgi:leucine-zipper of insertion element IS481
VAHARAKLIPVWPRLLVDRVLVFGWMVAEAARAAGVSRATCYRLSHIYRPSGIPVRFERARPGELMHLDVKKLDASLLAESIGCGARHGDRSVQEASSSGLRLSPRRRGRPLQGGLRPRLLRRTGRDRGAVPAGGRRVLRRSGHSHRAGPHRSPQLLPAVSGPFTGPPADRFPPQAHPRLPPPDQRQGRTIHPDLARRVGLRPALPVQRGMPEALPASIDFYNSRRPHIAWEATRRWRGSRQT